MKQDSSPSKRQQTVFDKLQFPLLDEEHRLTQKMKVLVRRINKKAKKQPTLHAKLIHEASEVKTPAIKLLAMTNKPGPNGNQSLRSFETADDLLKPENLFCFPEEVIKLTKNDLQEIQRLNEMSKLIQAAQRKLRKVLNAL